MMNPHVIENRPVADDPMKMKIAELEDKLADQANKFHDISRIGTVITSIMDLERILPAVIESALSIVKGEVGQIVIFNDEGGIENSVCWGISQRITDSIRNNDGTSLWEFIVDSGELLRIDDITCNPNWSLSSDIAHVTSLAATPLLAKNRIVGGIAIANKIEGDFFDDADLFILEMIARFAAVAVENSALHTQALAKQKLEADLEMAHQLQSTLMPDKMIDFGRLQIYAYNAMAMQVGGDFYDVVQLSRDKFILVIGDVSNKGFPASLLMASARSLIRAYAVETNSLAEIVMNVNEQLCSDPGGLRGMFVTLIMVYFDFGTGEMKAVNAGHPPGWIRFPNGDIENLKTGGTFVGQFPGLEFSEQILPLTPGSRIFLYTDGAFECVDGSGKMLGVSGLKTFFEKHGADSPEMFVNEMADLLKEYSVNPDWIDDTTYIVAEIKQP